LKLRAEHIADIGKLCGDGPATGLAGARLAELHERVAQGRNPPCGTSPSD
jgi:hypothetical protein